jgi:hypothetical protein
MKKILLSALLALAVAAPAFARGLITQGSNELSLSGAVDPCTSMGTTVDLGVRYGYFFWDYISLGPAFSFYNNDDVTSVGVGINGEYNFALSDDYRPVIGTDFVPYVGLGLHLQYSDLPKESNTAGVLALEGGLKFFLSDTAAVTTSVLGRLATDDVYADGSDSDSYDILVHLGMRFYF